MKSEKISHYYFKCGSTLLFAQFFNEIPYHIVSGAIFFCCFYFPLKIDNSASRAAVWYLNYSIIYQSYYISLGLFIAYMSPDLASSTVITSLFLTMMISFCGVVQPKSLMPGFWTFMWKISPLTYIIQTLIALILHEREVKCGKDEYNYFEPPSGMTCQEFAGSYVSNANGYLANPSADSKCAYCQYSVGDDYLRTVSASFGNRWRNFGFMWVYIIFNMFTMCAVYYIFRVANVSPAGYIKEKLEANKRKKEAKK